MVDVYTGQIIRYNGQLYVSAETRNWKFNEYYYTTPTEMNYNFLAINNKPAQTIKAVGWFESRDTFESFCW